MTTFPIHRCLLLFFTFLHTFSFASPQIGKTCRLRPLGNGRDDTDQVEAAIAKCGHFGETVFEPGSYNITRKMTWDLVSAKVDLNGYLSFVPNIDFWLNANNTYRVIFIQSQASWFVITGSDFEIDAHNSGGIQGNGQPWWSHFQTVPREDGDGRPVSLTIWKAARGVIRNFRIESPPFWSSAVAQSSDILLDGMFINATNEDPLYIGKNVVPNTDGIDTYRSERVTMLNWDVTCGDDCLAFKGNSTDIIARNITCRGGNGIAIGSVGQYANMSDNVLNVAMEDLRMIRLDASVQPNMVNGVYFKSWSGSVNGQPPTGGGGGTGLVSNISARNVQLDRVTAPVHVYQTNGGKSGDAPSTLKFEHLSFTDWSGTAITTKVVDIECSSAAGCNDMKFTNFSIAPPTGQTAQIICHNVTDVSGVTCTA
ncbi:hypothetical protein D9613_011052 [Agrocybe pediades]|uniref:galacturonan 1,4-alpha-galacturonidase n=1 Tax=Agrocybe pediades TaxID=84607 RepID=A0A8H4QM87_9AGAR|nr:hypothetical protein D9613_011052 [Agrocybe pediades]